MIPKMALKGPETDNVSRLRTKPEKANTSGLHIEPMVGANFILETVKVIDETPLSELEARLPEFIERAHQNAFVLGGALEKIRREKFWSPGSRKPQNALFERWVEQTCHYSGRKARYLITVYVGLVQSAVSSTNVLDIGWSKLRMIAPLLRPISGENGEAFDANRAHNDELVRLARSKSRKALEAALRAMLPDAKRCGIENSARTARRFVFNVRGDDAGIVTAALDTIAKETGHTGAAALVDLASAVHASDADATFPTLQHCMKKAGKDASLATYLRLFGRPSEF